MRSQVIERDSRRNDGRKIGRAESPAFLSETSLFGRTLRNRVAVAPMTRVSADEDGLATRRMQRYYGDFARGGFGIVITEGVYPDTDASQGYDRQPGIANQCHVDAWRPVAEEIRAGGAVAIMQLMHAGALSQRTLRGGRTVAPSPVLPRGVMMHEYGGAGSFPLPAELSEAEIHTIRDGFVQAAVRAHDAGFDGIELHAANGYLLDQFNTDYTNQRDDQYGGIPENRIRFAGEIIAAIRAALPSEFVAGVRVSEAKVNDFDYRWPGGTEEASTIFMTLATSGAGYIHMAGEGRGFRDAITAGAEPLTALARRLTGLPVIANGGLHDVEIADQVIRGGQADLIAIGRAALANPDWPLRIADGLEVQEFQPKMLSPKATIDNADHWREEHCSDGAATPARRESD